MVERNLNLGQSTHHVLFFRGRGVGGGCTRNMAKYDEGGWLLQLDVSKKKKNV
jgi:hypothetical protein